MPDLIDRNAMLKTLENCGVLGEFAKFLIKKTAYGRCRGNCPL